MGGTFDLVLTSDGLDLVRSLSVGTVWSGGVGTCTLLGPEGPGADRVSRMAGGGWWLFLEGLLRYRCSGGWGGYRPYFENYTVDASIFDMSLLVCVVKMILKIISQFFDDSTHVISSL